MSKMTEVEKYVAARYLASWPDIGFSSLLSELDHGHDDGIERLASNDHLSLETISDFMDEALKTFPVARVVVYLEGGRVDDLQSSMPVNYFVADLDVQGCSDDEIITLPDPRGGNGIYAGREIIAAESSTAVVRPDVVEGVFALVASDGSLSFDPSP